MSHAVALLDAVLALGLVFFAARAVFAGTSSVAAANFIALGALTALVWARLAAPDVALAEAAIGAGLTGALLLRHITLTSGED